MQHLNYIGKQLTTPEQYEAKLNYLKMKKESHKLQEAFAELAEKDGHGKGAAGGSDEEADGEFGNDDIEMVINRQVLRGDLWEGLNYFKYWYRFIFDYLL